MKGAASNGWRDQINYLSKDLQEQKRYYERRLREIAYILSRPDVVASVDAFLAASPEELSTNYENAGLAIIFLAKKYCDLSVVAYRPEDVLNI